MNKPMKIGINVVGQYDLGEVPEISGTSAVEEPLPVRKTF